MLSALKYDSADGFDSLAPSHTGDCLHIRGITSVATISIRQDSSLLTFSLPFQGSSNSTSPGGRTVLSSLLTLYDWRSFALSLAKASERQSIQAPCSLNPRMPARLSNAFNIKICSLMYSKRDAKDYCGECCNRGRIFSSMLSISMANRFGSMSNGTRIRSF